MVNGAFGLLLLAVEIDNFR